MLPKADLIATPVLLPDPSTLGRFLSEHQRFCFDLATRNIAEAANHPDLTEIAVASRKVVKHINQIVLRASKSLSASAITRFDASLGKLWREYTSPSTSQFFGEMEYEKLARCLKEEWSAPEDLFEHLPTYWQYFDICVRALKSAENIDVALFGCDGDYEVLLARWSRGFGWVPETADDFKVVIAARQGLMLRRASNSMQELVIPAFALVTLGYFIAFPIISDLFGLKLDALRVFMNTFGLPLVALVCVLALVLAQPLKRIRIRWAEEKLFRMLLLMPAA